MVFTGVLHMRSTRKLRSSAVSCLPDKAMRHRSKQCRVVRCGYLLVFVCSFLHAGAGCMQGGDRVHRFDVEFLQAVVGAGAAGLAAAKELQDEGHKVDVFEKSHSVGGVWVLDERVESDALGQSATRSIVHSSLYESLRVNLPREAMSFSDLPFLPEYMKVRDAHWVSGSGRLPHNMEQYRLTCQARVQGRSQDSRRFPHHAEVRAYLEAYAEHFQLLSVVNLNTEVLSVAPVRLPGDASTSPDTATSPDSGSSSLSHGSLLRGDGATAWKVTTAADGGATGEGNPVQNTHRYDAVMICNGHYTVPRLPPVEGIETFPGTCEHSHNYRRPGPYKDLKVLLVGAHASGVHPHVWYFQSSESLGFEALSGVVCRASCAASLTAALSLSTVAVAPGLCRQERVCIREYLQGHIYAG